MLTPFAFSFIFLAIIAWAITRKITLRQKSGKNPVWKVFVFFVVFILLMFTAGIPYYTMPKIYEIIALPRYEGKIVGHYTYYSDFSNNIGRSRVQMYQPYVAFTNQEGDQIEVLCDLAFDNPGEIGSFLTIGFKKGMEKATVISKMSILLLAGGGLLFLLTAYFSFMAVAYAIGKDIKPILRFGYITVITFIAPFGLAFCCIGFAYLSYTYFTGQRPGMPLWVAGVFTLLSIAMFFATWGYLKRLFQVRPWRIDKPN